MTSGRDTEGFYLKLVLRPYGQDDPLGNDEMRLRAMRFPVTPRLRSQATPEVMVPVMNEAAFIDDDCLTEAVYRLIGFVASDQVGCRFCSSSWLALA